ncbi:MAG: DUF58 domain-containing protein [Spirochaetota bacterium]
MDQKAGETDIGSIFGSTRALLLLTLLSLLALAFGSARLAIFTATTLALMAGVRFWARLSMVRLEVTLACNATRLFPGETLEVRAAISNRKILPVRVRAVMASSKALEPITEGGNLLEAGLQAFGRKALTWTYRAESRGVYHLGSAKLWAGDPLGLHRRGKALPFKHEVVVFPEPVALGRLDLPFRDYFGIHPAKGIIEDPAWYEGTREYTGNRPARNIHWKASARFHVLQEKIFEPTTHQKIFFLLDGEGFEAAEDRAGFESALRIISSLASRYAETGASIALATDRRVRGFPAILPLGRGPEHLGMLLELLARCGMRRGQSLLSQLRAELLSGAGFVVVSRSPGEGDEKYRSLVATRRDRLLFIHSDPAGTDGTADREPGQGGEGRPWRVLTFADLVAASEAP